MKKIHELLKEKRIESGNSLQTVSKLTKISLEQLILLEEGKWDAFNSYVYIQGMVKKYGTFFKIPSETLVALLRREFEVEEVKFIREGKYIKETTPFSPNVYLFLFLFTFLFFFGIQLLLSWRRPLLIIDDIPKKASSQKSVIVRGKTDPGTLLYLNEERLYQNEKGAFYQELFLKRGKRALILKAFGQNGKIEEKRITILVE
ncbi:MAG: helix-turn-helix domain-containing protein [Patescibacteria group bacterium]